MSGPPTVDGRTLTPEQREIINLKNTIVILRDINAGLKKELVAAYRYDALDHEPSYRPVLTENEVSFTGDVE